MVTNVSFNARFKLDWHLVVSSIWELEVSGLWEMLGYECRSGDCEAVRGAGGAANEAEPYFAVPACTMQEV